MIQIPLPTQNPRLRNTQYFCSDNKNDYHIQPIGNQIVVHLYHDGKRLELDTIGRKWIPAEPMDSYVENR